MARVYELDLTLRDATPRVWRRVRAPANLTLADLHRVIQMVMGWDDIHMHLFEVGDDEYGPPPEEEEEDEEPNTGDERRMVLGDAMEEGGGRINYVYDFRHEWHVDIVAAGDPVASPSLRIECLAGDGAPPIDGETPQFDIDAANLRLREEFAGRLAAGVVASTPDEELAADLTLLLLFLGAWREGSGTRVASKTLRLEILDSLAEAGLIVTNPHRKTVALTAAGVKQAEALRQRLTRFTRGS